MMEKVQCHKPYGNGAILKTQNWFLLMADWHLIVAIDQLQLVLMSGSACR